MVSKDRNKKDYMFMLKNKRISLMLIVTQLIGLFGVLAPQVAEASGQLVTRSLAISDSTPSKTSVSYSFTFTPSSTAAIGSIAFEFCSQDPLQSNTCTKPTGMTTTSAGLQAGQTGNTGFTLVNTTDGYPYLTRASSAAVVTASNYVLTTIINPSTAGNTTWYLRIMTFTATAPAASNATSDASAVDFGGVAWATDYAVPVTAKVQETLTFCTFVTGSCAAPAGTVDLGILTTAQSTAANSTFQVGTNAQNGCVVQYFGATLTSGANTIAAATGVTAPAGGGTEFFGINLASANGNLKTPAGGAYAGSAAPTGSAPIASVNTTPTDYSGANVFNYVVSASAPLGATPGAKTTQTVAFSASPINLTTAVVNYAAGINSTTKPGVYTTTVQYVGTGIF